MRLARAEIADADLHEAKMALFGDQIVLESGGALNGDPRPRPAMISSQLFVARDFPRLATTRNLGAISFMRM